MDTSKLITVTSIKDYNRFMEAAAESPKDEKKRLRTLAKEWMQARVKEGHRFATWNKKDLGL